MQKHLLRYPWIFLAAFAVILSCAFLILRMLFAPDAAPETLPSDVRLVKEAFRHAAL